MAGSGRNVEWAPGAGLTVDGQSLDWHPLARDGAPLDFAMTVPDDQVLIAPVTADDVLNTSAGLRLVAKEAVAGKPWARLYPIWTRRLLL